MIHSRILNFIILIVGTILVLLGIQDCYTSLQSNGMKYFRLDPAGVFLDITLLILGSWCTYGSLRNLIEARHKQNEAGDTTDLHQKTIISYSIAKWHLLILLISGLLTAILILMGIRFAFLMNSVFLFAFFTIPITVILHYSIRKRS